MRKYFYKYTDIKTAEAMLDNQSFRYSSPLKFNDPFDVQNDLHSSFDLSDFPAATMSVIESYVKNDIPIPNANDGIGKVIMMLRDVTKGGNYKKSKIESIVYPMLGEIIKIEGGQVVLLALLLFL